MPHIEFPEPVIRAEIDWCETKDDTYVVDVLVGGVPVMTTSVPRSWRPESQGDYAESVEEAEQMALKAFGERMKEIFDGPQAGKQVK